MVGRKIILKIKLALLLFNLSPLIAEPFVTSKEYAEFLNSTATSDEHHLYDLKMHEEILRSGAPGSYFYTTKGEERAISFVDAFSATCYANWKNSNTTQFCATISSTAGEETPEFFPDSLLKINDLHFAIMDKELILKAPSPVFGEMGLEEEAVEEALSILTVIGGNAFKGGRDHGGLSPMHEENSHQLNRLQVKEEGPKMIDTTNLRNNIRNRRPMNHNINNNDPFLQDHYLDLDNDVSRFDSLAASSQDDIHASPLFEGIPIEEIPPHGSLTRSLSSDGDWSSLVRSDSPVNLREDIFDQHELLPSDTEQTSSLGKRKVEVVATQRKKNTQKTSDGTRSEAESDSGEENSHTSEMVTTVKKGNVSKITEIPPEIRNDFNEALGSGSSQEEINEAACYAAKNALVKECKKLLEQDPGLSRTTIRRRLTPMASSILVSLGMRLAAGARTIDQANKILTSVFEEYFPDAEVTEVDKETLSFFKEAQGRGLNDQDSAYFASEQVVIKECLKLLEQDPRHTRTTLRNRLANMACSILISLGVSSSDAPPKASKVATSVFEKCFPDAEVAEVDEETLSFFKEAQGRGLNDQDAAYFATEKALIIECSEYLNQEPQPNRRAVQVFLNTSAYRILTFFKRPWQESQPASYKITTSVLQTHWPKKTKVVDGNEEVLDLFEKAQERGLNDQDAACDAAEQVLIKECLKQLKQDPQLKRSHLKNLLQGLAYRTLTSLKLSPKEAKATQSRITTSVLEKCLPIKKTDPLL